MTDYAELAARGAELRTKDTKASTRCYRQACHLAAESSDGYESIRRVLIRQLEQELTEGGAKGVATKFATVALWIRAGNSWPEGKGLTATYDIARGKRVVCPNCSHSFAP